MEHVNFFIVFIEGLLSIFSPCILPILPIYLSMLSNSSIEDIKDSNFKSTVLIRNTIFFTLGISVTFFILGSSISALGSFFDKYKSMIMIIGGIIIVLMGLFYVGIIKSELLNREKRLNVKTKAMSPLTAFTLGFAFSFGWTPCIGPILASVIIMASSSANIVTSNLMILVYTLGFILPFIVAALFYSKLFKKFDNLKKYMGTIKKVSGVIIIVAGLLMLFNGFSAINNIANNSTSNNNSNNSSSSSNSSTSEEEEKIKAIDFTLYDQYGNEHTLSDYEGKTIFLNFWATWCPPCRGEMPHIEELYNEYGLNKEDVVILGVASPNLGREGDDEYVKSFLSDNDYTFPVLLDEGGEMVYQYGINAFPTTFIIDKEGYITKYIPGAMSKETMKNVIEN
ncbi:cytochrome c biogenesis protein/redoxin [Clostridioides difficile]